MDREYVEQIAKAVLYEGYLLYPYRRSSVKNRQRFNFGMLYPRSSGHEEGPSAMRIECLLQGRSDARVKVNLRFLHLRTRATRASEEATPEECLAGGWQEATERKVEIPAFTVDDLARHGIEPKFEFRGATEFESDEEGDFIVQQENVHGSLQVSTERLDDDVWKVRIRVSNTTAGKVNSAHRDEALMQSLVSTHAVLGVERGEFVSLLEPLEALKHYAAQCENVGAWPVLVGAPGQRDRLLASPIILYDYPQIAPQSAGDLFDGTEIDEILSLRILTLTDEEKREIRAGDGRGREILERIESMPAEQFLKMHGAVRSLRPIHHRAVNLSSPEEDA